MDITTLALIGIAAIAAITLWLKLGNVGSAILLLLAGLAVIGCFVFVHSFQALTSKTQVATVSCVTAANTPHTMLVRLNDKVYYLGGDRWMLQSSVVQFSDWTMFLGIKAGWSLDRLNSQFDDVNAHTVRPVELGGFSLYKSTSLWRYFPLIKSAFGNGVIEPCDGRAYNVFVDVNGEMFAVRA